MKAKVNSKTPRPSRSSKYLAEISEELCKNEKQMEVSKNLFNRKSSNSVEKNDKNIF